MSGFMPGDPAADANVAMRLLSPADMQVASLRHLGFAFAETGGGGEVEEQRAGIVSLSVHAEALRAALWALSAGGSDPIYVTRLLHVARPLAVPALVEHDGGETDESTLSSLKDVLDELETIGDVAALPRGRWLPSPLRSVPLPAIHRWVLIGGRPTHRLPATLRHALEHNGVARLLTSDPVHLNIPLPVQSLDDWTRSPREALADWTQRVMDGIALRSFDDPEASFEYYAPSVVGNRPQYFRWIPNTNMLSDGRYLARQKAKSGPTSYSVLELRKGKVIATGSLDYEEGDVRRLRYGLDSLAGHPTRVRVTHSHSRWAFQLRSELPSSEHRLFSALGRLRLPADGGYYPRTWEIAAGYAGQAVRALRRLDVHLDGADELVEAVDEADYD